MRIRQIEADLDLKRSRIGGQGNGFGTSIDHNIVLDPCRNIDELIEAEEEYACELAICRADVSAAETLLAGAEPRIVNACVSDGLGPDEAVKNASDMVYAMRLWYVEGADPDLMTKMTGYDYRVNATMLRRSVDFLDQIGIAHLKAAIPWDDRTPAQLRAEYM